MAANSPGNGRKTKRSAPSRIAPAPDSDTLELDELLTVLTAVRKGDFSVRMRPTRTGQAGKVADLLNEIIELNQGMAREFERVSLAVGKEGRITQRANLTGAAGSWAASQATYPSRSTTWLRALTRSASSRSRSGAGLATHCQQTPSSA